MKFNKKIFAIFAVLIVFIGLNSTIYAQKRKVSTRKTTVAKTSANTLDIKAGAEKVSTQIKNLTKFIYLLGGIARNIEDIDKDSRSGKFSRTAVTQNETNKKNVIASIKNLRAGLAALEVEFRTKPALKNYLFQISGVTDICGRAEDQATGGQFTESGKTLLLVVEKLSDTLAAMP
ncbi:MAG TPA: hypothetical protein PKY59_11005 [Pyrinomonadaceae bacterium]|nr:hypothetical protein [Pyrinomonadaceae bacterium]